MLPEGTDKCPDVWLLWQLLGNYLSDEGQLEEAFEAYQRGLRIDESNMESLNLNYAIALMRSGKATMARERIRPIIDATGFRELDGSIQARILAVELEALRILDRCEAALACFEDIGGHDFGGHAGEELSILWTEYARSLVELNRYHEADEAAVQSVVAYPVNSGSSICGNCG